MKIISSYLLVFYSVCVTQTYAQPSPEIKPSPKFPNRVISQFEISAGPMLSYPIRPKDPGVNRQIKVGPIVMISLVHSFTEKFSLALSASFEQKGSKSVFPLFRTDVLPNREEKLIQTVTLSYVSLAVPPRYSPIPQVPIYVSAGPYLSYLLKEKDLSESFYEGKLVGKSGGTPDPPGYSNFDYGITACVGYKLFINQSISGIFELRYNRGLTTINKSYITNLTNNSFSFLVGIPIAR